MKIKLKRKKNQAKGLLIHEDELNQDFSKLPKDWVMFLDEENQFLSWGYLGKQNKGMGWLLPETTEKPETSFFITLFKEAFLKRETLFTSKETTAFRLFNGAGDGLGGFTCDYYDGYCVWSFYNETIDAFTSLLKESFMQAYEETFEVPVKGIVIKNRYQSAKVESINLLQTVIPESFLVLENGISYRVYLEEGLMTGIFLDQKEVRHDLKKVYGKGKRVLNTFSYTGAFSVAAYAGGAKETTSVDLAKRSRKKTEEQFEANDFSLNNQKIYVMDIFDYFSYGKKKQLTYDLIVLDPPSFARNKKKTFSVHKNYSDLIEGSLALMKFGYLLCSTNAANLTLKEFKEMIKATFKKENRHYQIEKVYRLPEDFPYPKENPEENYLKVILLKVID